MRNFYPFKHRINLNNFYLFRLKESSIVENILTSCIKNVIEINKINNKNNSF